MTEEITETNVDKADNKEPSMLDELAGKADLSEGKPEGIPDDFWDSESSSIKVEELVAGYKNESARARGLREKLSKGEFTGEVPKDESGYELELPDFVASDDPIMSAAKQAALKAGLPKEKFAEFMSPVLEAIGKLSEEQAAIDNAPLSEEELAEYRAVEYAKLGKGGQAMAAAYKGFIDDIAGKGLLSDELKQEAYNLAYNADSLRVLNVLRSIAGGASREVNVDVPIDTKASRSDIATKMSQAASSGNKAEYEKWAAKLHALQT